MRLLVFAMLAGCGKDAPPTPSGPPPEEPLDSRDRYVTAIETGKRLTGPGLAIAAKPLPATAPGPAYLRLTGAAVVKLDQGKATRIELPGLRTISALAADGDDLYVAEGGQLYRKRGDTLDKLAKADDVIAGLVVGPDHRVWARASRAVYRLDKDRWTRFEDVGVIGNFGVDGGGRLLVDGAGVFAVDSKLEPIIDFRAVSNEQRERAPCLSVPAISPSGELWIGACSHVIRIAKGKAKFHELAEPGTIGGRFVGDKFYGMAWLKPGLIRVALDGKLEAHEKTEFFPKAIDGRGRMWSVSNTKGIEVRTLGSKPIVLPIGSVPEINADVISIHIVGSGPDELPGVTGEVSRGTIAGTVKSGGVPVANAAVELCSQPRQEFEIKKTPCSDAPERVTGKTDANGRFAIEAVLRSYQVVVQVEFRWFALPRWEKGCGGLAPGEVCDMGVLEAKVP